MPFYEQTDLPSGTTILLWHITETEQEFMKLGGNPLAWQLLLMSQPNAKRRRELLAVRMLLKTYFGKVTEIRYSDAGVPMLAGNAMQLSVSHTGDWAAIALHPTRKIGIDIETIGNKVERVAHKFLSEEEAEHIPKTSGNIVMHLYWCAKEALYKAIGKTGVDFIQHLHVDAFDTPTKGTTTACEKTTPDTQPYRLQYRTYDDFVLVCAEPIG